MLTKFNCKKKCPENYTGDLFSVICLSPPQELEAGALSALNLDLNTYFNTTYNMFNFSGSDGHSATLASNFSRISPNSRSLRLPPSGADNDHHHQRLTPPQVEERHSPPNERDSLASPDIISRVSVRLTPPVSPGRPPRDSSGDKQRDSEGWPQRQNRRSPGNI